MTQYLFRGVLVTEIEKEKISDSIVKLERVCPFCKKRIVREISIFEWSDIYFGEDLHLIDPNVREMFITGICEKCWPEEPDE